GRGPGGAPGPGGAAPGATSGGAGPAPAAPPLAPVRPRASSALLLLTTLAAGAAMWAAQPVLLPILLAMFFALIGNPLIRGLQRLYLPRAAAALLVLFAGMAGTTLLASQLVDPAAEWARQVP